MALTAAECDRMIAAARTTGRRLSVNLSARLDPAVLRALKLLRMGACGDVLAIDYLRSSEYAPYRGGVRPPHYAAPHYPFHDLGIHGLSVIEAYSEFGKCGLQEAERGIDVSHNEIRVFKPNSHRAKL